MNQLYYIKDWNVHFETSETRKYSKLRWWPKPNKHDGLGFRKMASQKDACDLYAAWNLMADIASKTTPPNRRGYLERDGKPLSPQDMAMSTGFPERAFARALSFFASSDIQWLCVESAVVPGDSPATPGDSPAVPGDSPVERKKERTERTGVGGVGLFSQDVDAFELFPALDNPEFKEAWERWHQHLKQKRKPATIHARDLQLAKLSKMGCQKAIETINHCIEHNWQGIYEAPTQQPKKAGKIAV